MKLKTWIALALPLVIVASLAIALPLGAQQVAVPKIAVINGDRVIEESNIGQTVSEQAQSRADEWTTRIEAKQTELNNLARQRQEQALTLNEEALIRLDADIEQRNVELNRLRDDANRDLQTLSAQYQGQINAALVPAVERLAAAGGYDLILDTRVQGLLYFSATLDVTDEFIAMVNEGVAGAQQ
jgi:outer membrane protein